MSMVLEDYTQAILNGEYMIPDVDGNLEDDLNGDINITASLLRRRPDIRQAVLEVLADLIIPWEGDDEEPIDFIDNQILIALKMDPFVEATIMECLLEMTDCRDAEGEEVYYPSIFDTDNVDEIHEQLEIGGYREDKQPIPAKYSHLDEEYIEMIYTHPVARKILSTMPSEAITKEIVKQLCS